MRREPPRCTSIRGAVRPAAVAWVVIVAALIVYALLLDPPTLSSATPSNAAAPPGMAGAPSEDAPSRSGSRLGKDDGLLPDGVTAFDDRYPGIANLDPELLVALRAAASDAANEGVVLDVSSGWRSPAYQDRLLREAVAVYGSEEAAARWVATAATSPHVTGDAVDIGSDAAWRWLSEHGARYRLCQVYRNEPWHYELRREAADRGCPAPYTDPTHDPRMWS